jgi:hypothetical protein
VSEELTNHIDELSASLQDRKRDQVANHIRTIPEQTLDALLRIEELLIARNTPWEPPKPEYEWQTDALPDASVTPKATPLLDKLSEKRPEQRKKPKQL